MREPAFPTMLHSFFCVCAVAAFLWHNGSLVIARALRNVYAAVVRVKTNTVMGAEHTAGEIASTARTAQATASSTATTQPAQRGPQLPRKLLASVTCTQCMRPAADTRFHNQRLCCSKCKPNDERPSAHTEHCNLRNRGCEIALRWSEENVL